VLPANLVIVNRMDRSDRSLTYFITILPPTNRDPGMQYSTTYASVGRGVARVWKKVWVPLSSRAPSKSIHHPSQSQAYAALFRMLSHRHPIDQSSIQAITLLSSCSEV
jgi:hypothetical protein